MKDPVTDHAVLRWIERRYGIDVEAEREKIRYAVNPYLSLNTVLQRDGMKFCIRNGYVVTVLSGDMGTRRGFNRKAA